MEQLETELETIRERGVALRLDDRQIDQCLLRAIFGELAEPETVASTPGDSVRPQTR